MRGLTGLRASSMTVAGGGARNKPPLKAKADITGMRLSVPAQTELTALGAALFARKAIEDEDPPELPAAEIRPGPGCPGKWDQRYREYLALCSALANNIRKE